MLVAPAAASSSSSATASAAAASAASAASASSLAGRLGRIFFGLHRPDARNVVLHGSSFVARAYRASPWGYSGTGALTAFFADRLATYDGDFYWRTLGCFLMLQGFLSYMADVYAFGKPASPWHARDKYMATALTLVVGPLLGGRMLAGHCAVPAATGYLWVVSVVLALCCKCLGAYCSRHVRRIEPFLAFHTGWHLLPFVSCGVVVDLAARATQVQ